LAQARAGQVIELGNCQVAIIPAEQQENVAHR